MADAMSWRCPVTTIGVRLVDDAIRREPEAVEVPVCSVRPSVRWAEISLPTDWGWAAGSVRAVDRHGRAVRHRHAVRRGQSRVCAMGPGRGDGVRTRDVMRSQLVAAPSPVQYWAGEEKVPSQVVAELRW